MRPAGSARPSGARSATACWPSGRWCRCCPARDEFPYAIRQVSEALSSNGSTSMGSVCASTMSLLNAGVPLKAPVAGIAMGLVSDEVDGKTEYVALTDILGAEDAFGDMDFKVAGTKEFVTALQLDTKLDGHPVRGAGRGARPGPRRPADHPRGHGRGHRPAGRDEPVRPAGHRDQDPGRQDRRGDRPEGQDDQLDHRGDRRRTSPSRTTARSTSAPATARPPRPPST